MSDGRFDIDAETGARVNAVNRLNAKEVRFGDTYESNAPREIRVTGVGEHPPNYADYWVDRTSYETQLRDRLLQAPVTQILAEGGFGKSSLAAWGYDHYQDFEIPFKKRVWVNLGRSQSFDRFARYVLQELGRPVGDPQANDESLMRELVLQLNDPNGAVRMLVVLDQVEAAIERSEWDWYGQFLQEWAVKGRRSAVLVTSRSLLPSGVAIELGGLSDVEGLVFFDRLGVTGEYRSALIKLAKGHPLLLKLAASWTIETYDARVDDRAIDFFTKLFTNYTGDPKAGVEAIFEVIFRALPPALQNLLCGLSVYRLPIDVAMAQAMDETATGEDLEQLAGQGLLLLQGTRFVLHPLVAGLVRAQVTEEVRRDGHERAIGYYTENVQDWDGTIESCRSELEGFYHACEIEDYWSAYIIIDHCFEVLRRAGRWRLLLPLYTKLINEWHPSNTEEYEKSCRIATILGDMYHSLAEDKIAIQMHLKALEISKLIGDLEQEGAAISNIGNCYESAGNYQKALENYYIGLKIHREVENAHFEAISLHNIGNIYRVLDDYRKAIQYHLQALEISHGLECRDLEGSILCDIGLTHYHMGNHRKAINFYAESIEILHEMKNFPHEANCSFNMALALYSINKYKGAISKFEDAKIIYKDLQLNTNVEECDQEISSCKEKILIRYGLKIFAIIVSFSILIYLLIQLFRF
jgi:tetratricopeptide (TPR) repeat protein